ncbi:acid phosphatase [Apiospora sp. TS-2023a]
MHTPGLSHATQDIVMPAYLYQRLLAVFHWLTACYFQSATLDSGLSASAPVKHIVIVGGSFSALHTAHRILKNAKSVLGSQGGKAKFNLTLVSRDSHFYWNLASPRAIIPGQFTDEQMSQPIAEGFRKYAEAGQFEFVLASITGLDAEAKRIELVAVGSEGEGDDHNRRMLDYDFLVLATGASQKVSEVPFKSMGSTEATMAALHDMQNRVGAATTVVVVGAGPTGVETAAEIKFAYGNKKEVILISSLASILPGRPEKVARAALQKVLALGVDVRLSTRVLKTTQIENGRTELNLDGPGVDDSGEDARMVTDLHIPAYGETPNSSYMPREFVDNEGHILTGAYLNVPGADGVYALGDVTNVDPAQFVYMDVQTKHMAKNLLFALAGRPLKPYKPATWAIFGLQIGRNDSTGHYNSIQFPYWLMVWVRKNLYTEWLPGTVDGSRL